MFFCLPVFFLYFHFFSYGLWINPQELKERLQLTVVDLDQYVPVPVLLSLKHMNKNS